MASFGILFFFAITGLTLNHVEWFANQQSTKQAKGTLNAAWLKPQATAQPASSQPQASAQPASGAGLRPAQSAQSAPSPDTGVQKLEIVEQLRKTHAIKAALSDFRIDDNQLSISFKGPGYSADIFVDRASANYELTETRNGWGAIINDLHKGRDSGHAWSVMIDASAILMVLVSISGMAIIFFLPKRRTSGLISLAAGALICYGIYAYFVP